MYIQKLAICDIQSYDYAYATMVLAACMCYTQCVACAIPHNTCICTDIGICIGNCTDHCNCICIGNCMVLVLVLVLVVVFVFVLVIVLVFVLVLGSGGGLYYALNGLAQLPQDCKTAKFLQESQE